MKQQSIIKRDLFAIVSIAVFFLLWNIYPSIYHANKNNNNNKMETVKKYFDVWNAHDAAGLKELFDASVALRDWDVAVSGAAEVAEANGNIFKAVPAINIEVLQIHEAKNNVFACEILVHLNNDAKEVLKVVDMIELSNGKIKAVRAYKG